LCLCRCHHTDRHCLYTSLHLLRPPLTSRLRSS
jgi:hypothetical protein